MSAINWNRYQVCPACGAEQGSPCLSILTSTVRSTPHRARKKDDSKTADVRVVSLNDDPVNWFN